MPVVSLARCVGRGVGGVGAGMGHASLPSYGGGGLSRAGKERASLARCEGRSVGGVGVGMACIASKLRMKEVGSVGLERNARR